MTKSKIATALAALTLAASLTAASGQAQAHHCASRRLGLGIGLAAGTLIGAAAASNAYYDGYTDCRYVERYDRWGNFAHREGLRRRSVLIRIQLRSAPPPVHPRADR